MEWLTNNPLADMRGPDFLILYAATVVAALLVGRYLIRNSDPTNSEPPIPPPARPNPFELAYMRGGEEEVARFTVFKLIQDRLVMLSTAKTGTMVRIEDPARMATLTGIERAIYEILAIPRTLKDIATGFSHDFQRHCIPFVWNLKNQGLLATAPMKETALRVRMSLVILIFGLGFYKIAVALSKGRMNFGFLVILAVVGIVLAFKISRAPHLSKRGKNYLKQLRAQMNPGRSAPPEDVDNDDLALQVALMGSVVLAGTVYAEYANALTSPRSSSGDATGGCGAGDTDSGGGGSSDSGGSDGGGGGCGGCGGGGD